MKNTKLIITIQFALLLFFISCSAIPPNSQRILLQNIQSLTLHKGQYTTARRVQPIPQLNCVGGEARYDGYQPDVVQCVNKGFDGRTVNWKCEADMDDKYRFGRMEVVCEGYDHPDDPYVLVGSCGLEYTLEYTEKGRNKRYRQNHQRYHHDGHTEYQTGRPYYTESSSDWGGFFLIMGIIIFIAIAICIFSPACEATRTYFSPGYPVYSSTTYYPSPAYHSPGGYWSGFATGTAVGGTMGYAAGRAHSSSHSTGGIYPNPDNDDYSSSRTTTGYATTRKR